MKETKGELRKNEWTAERMHVKYSLLKEEIVRLWQMNKVDLIPIVVGALGSITIELEKYIKSLRIEISIEHE